MDEEPNPFSCNHVHRRRSNREHAVATGGVCGADRARNSPLCNTIRTQAVARVRRCVANAETVRDRGIDSRKTA
jgi:hypothetical protein